MRPRSVFEDAVTVACLLGIGLTFYWLIFCWWTP